MRTENRRRTLAGAAVLLLIMTLLNAGFSTEILPRFLTQERNWQISGALISAVLEDCRTEPEQTQTVSRAEAAENKISGIRTHWKVLLDISWPCIFVFALWIWFQTDIKKQQHSLQKRMLQYIQCIDLP